MSRTMRVWNRTRNVMFRMHCLSHAFFTDEWHNTRICKSVRHFEESTAPKREPDVRFYKISQRVSELRLCKKGSPLSVRNEDRIRKKEKTRDSASLRPLLLCGGNNSGMRCRLQMSCQVREKERRGTIGRTISRADNVLIARPRLI